jgi:hypothetical protein
MPANTTYLQMSLFNSTTDGSATFASWRAAIDGVSPTSNFNLLDTFAQNISASVISLQGRAIYLVPAVYVSPNYYEANSVTSITALTTNMYLDLYLDTTNVGSVTLNINALGTKTLKKIDATGALVDLDSNDLEKNKEYLFRYNGTVFVWVAVSSGTSGTTYSGSALITITGSKISHTVSGVTPGTYTSANLTVDDYGHLTAVSNGTSASSTGAPSDTPFIVSGSVAAGVTNAKLLVGGSCIVLTESGSTLIVASNCIPLTEISGSSVMSDTTGSSVKHNYSGVTAGSANKVQYDSFGHVISASVVPVAQTATITAGQVLQTYDASTGLFGKVAIPTSATGVAGRALYSYDAATGSFVNVPIPITSTVVANRVLNSYTSTTGSFTNTPIPITATSVSNKVLNSYDSTTGSFTNIAIPISASGTGKALSSYDSATGSFVNSYLPITATQVTGRVLDSYNSITGSFTNVAVLNGIAGSSVMSDTTGSQIKHNYSGVISGSANKVSFDSFGHIQSASSVFASETIVGDIQIATASQTTTGSAINNLAISPSGLAHSDYGKRAIEFTLNGVVALTTSDKAHIRTPSLLNGWKLISVEAMNGDVITGTGTSTNGSPVFTVKSGSTSMLTTNISIDQGEYDSSTASASAVIDTSNNTFSTGKQLEVACSTSGSGVTYAVVELIAQAP